MTDNTFDTFDWSNAYFNGADLLTPKGRALWNGNISLDQLDDDFDPNATDEHNDHTAEAEELALSLIWDALDCLDSLRPHDFDPTGERVEDLRNLADNHTDPTVGAWIDTLAEHLDTVAYVTPNTFEATRWELAVRVVAALFLGDLDNKTARETFDTLTN